MRLVSKPEHHAERFDQAAFAQPRQPDQQHMAAAEEGDQGLVHNLLLAEDDPADRRAHRPDAVAERLYLVQDGMIRRGLKPICHAGRHPSLRR